MDWRLICTWNDSKEKQDNQNFKKTFSLLPTVDHTDPNASDLEFEICSWLVNDSKSCLNAQEFVDLCTRVARFGGVPGVGKKKSAAKYLDERLDPTFV
jgi:hypothetical protein